ncbi:hypothetical protein CFK37_17400 [Virgibacillus phasianinus]|uniref:Uncharacterized protein n=1 Tax=Virgibacillus phasianinus TaxID=2017483 RepID=A0A220U7E0_9BACI|nr:hypothetical protein [Virgibacillus phasianinus]ASK63806.1 hypothetical protein CFK37_17400 [Virgibacillus phasianinus]
MNEQELYDEIYETKERLTMLITEHWKLYSNMDTWFFWFDIITVVVPLVVLFFTIDRKRLFEISFFGYSLHIIWTGVDSFLTSHNYFNHPHSISYMLPQGITVTAVLFPVFFMLLYQYCTNNGKNFYLFALIGTFVFAIGFGFFTDLVDLLRMHKGMNLFYLFLIDFVIVLIAFGMTKLFQCIKNTVK